MLELVGFDEFEKTLVQTIEVKFPKEIEKILFKIANKLYQRVYRKTPVSDKEYFYSGGRKVRKTASKRMKNRWKIGKVKKKQGQFYIEVKNTAPHAHLVENGHIAPNGTFVKGLKILEINVKELEKELPMDLRAWLNQMLKELEL